MYKYKAYCIDTSNCRHIVEFCGETIKYLDNLLNFYDWEVVSFEKDKVQNDIIPLNNFLRDGFHSLILSIEIEEPIVEEPIAEKPMVDLSQFKKLKRAKTL